MGRGEFDALDILGARTERDLQRVRTAPESATVDGDVQRHVFKVPAREERHDEWPKWADTELVAGWRALGVDRPWAHQVAAAQGLHRAQTTLLATSTGSGKSLSYWLPALTAARLPRGSGYGTTLYLAPTKALAGDQLSAVRTVLEAANITDVGVTTVDGDTEFEQRRWAEAHAQVILTNPDMLHHSLLPNHSRWRRFFKHLRYIVVDEAHAYRGVFGAHVSAVLRRLTRIAH
ncbi:MAG TPA: DEAD/DEAH box helicase, partial [Actinomycetales bacterium]|nr:DEAD/DEAH box helicase [Actinomycetales bacterium]